MRRKAIWAAALACLASAPARGGLITDTYKFRNTSLDGGTVSGAFSYDDAVKGPFKLTSFTLTDSSEPFYDFSTTGPGLTFDGTTLSGTINASARDNFVFFEFAKGALGASNSVTFTDTFLGIIPLGSDKVTGPIVITAAAPEPATIVSAGTAACAGLIAFGWRRRNKAARA